MKSSVGKEANTINLGYILSYALTVGVSSLIFGIEFKKFNVLITPLKIGLSQGHTIGFFLGGVFGCILTGLMIKYGRRLVLIAASLIAILSNVPFLFYPDNKEINEDILVYICLFLNGICLGQINVVVPLFLKEISPADMRGRIGTLHMGIIFVGYLICNILKYTF